MAIIGGGIAGLTLALTLKDGPLDWRLIDPDIEPGAAGAALAMAPNALWVFRQLGIAEPITAAGSAIHIYQYRNHHGNLLKQIHLSSLITDWQESPWCVPRTHIIRVLHDAISSQRLISGKVVHITAEHPVFRLHTSGGTVRHTLPSFDAIVGADGAHSDVRSWFFNAPPLEFEGFIAIRGTVTWDLSRPDTVTQILGPQSEFGYSPMGPHKVYWYATLPVHSPQTYPTKEDIRYHFRLWAPPVPDLIAATPAENLLIHPIYHQPRWSLPRKQRVTLIGDAAHLMTPNTGQGACQAILDAYVLGSLLGKETDTGQAFHRYVAKRWHAAEEVASLSRQLGRMIHRPMPPLLRPESVLRMIPTALIVNRMHHVMGHPEELSHL